MRRKNEKKKKRGRTEVKRASAVQGVVKSGVGAAAAGAAAAGAAADAATNRCMMACRASDSALLC